MVARKWYIGFISCFVFNNSLAFDLSAIPPSQKKFIQIVSDTPNGYCKTHFVNTFNGEAVLTALLTERDSLLLSEFPGGNVSGWLGYLSEFKQSTGAKDNIRLSGTIEVGSHILFQMTGHKEFFEPSYNTRINLDTDLG